jgi:hypothetical protein
MPKIRPLRFALLVDADNVSLRAVSAALPEIGRLGTVGICRVYGRLTKAMRPGWVAAIRAGGCPPPRIVYRAGPNAADFALTMDAVEMVQRGDVDGFCLLSSDGDFVHVARRLREKGCEVHVFAPPTAARSLKRAAGTFHAIGQGQPATL